MVLKRLGFAGTPANRVHSVTEVYHSGGTLYMRACPLPCLLFPPRSYMCVMCGSPMTPLPPASPPYGAQCEREPEVSKTNDWFRYGGVSWGGGLAHLRIELLCGMFC